MKTSSGNTSALRRHAETQHAKQWKEIKDDENKAKQPTVKAYFVPKADKYPLNSKKRRILNRKLMRFIAKDMRPLTVTRNAGFREFLEELDPRYTLPSVNTIRTKLLPSMYQECVDDLKSQLEKVDHCAITTDGWTSTSTDKYQAYTVHFIDWSAKEPKLVSKILECAPYDKKGTAIELEKDLRRVLDEYNITSKASILVADNAKDIQAALSMFGSPKLGCGAHKFNLAAKYAIQNCRIIEALKKKLAKLVRTTKVSAGAKKTLIECCKKVGIKRKFC